MKLCQHGTKWREKKNQENYDSSSTGRRWSCRHAETLHNAIIIHTSIFTRLKNVLSSHLQKFLLEERTKKKMQKQNADTRRLHIYTEQNQRIQIYIHINTVAAVIVVVVVVVDFVGIVVAEYRL